MKNIVRTIVALLLLVFLSGLFRLFFAFDEAFAAGGPGESGTAVNTYNCNNTTSFTVNTCPDHTGGASWHLFKIPAARNSSTYYKYYNLYKNGPRYCKKNSGYNDKTGNCSRPRALKGNGVEYDGKLTTKCKNTDNMKYYMAYVFDGCNGNSNKSLNGTPKKKNVFTYWGPAAYGLPLKGKSKDYKVTYNSYQAKKTPTIEEGLTNGTNMHTWKLTKGAALNLYKSMHLSYSGKDVPHKLGYECLETRWVKLYAVDQETGKLLSKKTIDYKMVMRGRNASVSVKKSTWRPTITVKGDTYTYQKKICTSKSGSGCKSDVTKYTISKIKNNKNLYAMYKKAPEEKVIKNSDISIEVKNDSNSANQKYKSYQSLVYAKPGDVVKYRVTYEPDAQVGYSWKVKSVKVNGQQIDSSTQKTIGSLWTAWENTFSVGDLWTKTFNESKGSAAEKVVESTDCTNNCNIKSSSVGSEIAEYVKTSSNTPTKVTKQDDKGTVLTNVLEDVARVRVPYNFRMKASISQNTGIVYAGERAENVGEYILSLKNKVNAVTTDGSKENAYSTKAENVAGKVIVFIPGSDEDVDEDWSMDDDEQSVDWDDGEEEGEGEGDSDDEEEYTEEDTDDGDSGGDNDVTEDLDEDDDEEGEDDMVDCGDSGGCRNISAEDFCDAIGSVGFCDVEDIAGLSKSFEGSTGGKYSFNVPDMVAGSYICAIAAVYPADSGSDDNIEVSGYKDAWKLSESKCFKVAKRPSLQVWGGNVYSIGRISTAVADKVKISTPEAERDNIKRKFGSWGELGVISFNGSDGFGSGASLGYQSISSTGALEPRYNPANGNGNNTGDNPALGGNKSLFYPLTIPNPSQLGFSTSVSTTGNEIAGDLASIVSKFGYKGEENISDKNNVILNNANNLKDAENNIYYYYGKGNLIIPAQWVRGGIQVVHATGDIEITGNLMYPSSYAKLGDIPKLVIYSEKDVKIDCGVGQIDALIIADNVDTCGNSNNVNSRDNSNQLRVNGAIIAGSLKANRTYGAATGANSMIPAEIINFDPTLYKWGGKEADNNDNGDEMSNDSDIHLESVYTRELAPRQ
ncbi:hypothetical protein IKD98_00400 [Candidatus Saccharibacteria bacterium]|nr:hypothetical protein [Candidatus Saccharibacteria bacterium]MBR3122241.1 hypothetical protein [Candidatus Saccharibacteria bacterium]